MYTNVCLYFTFICVYSTLVSFFFFLLLDLILFFYSHSYLLSYTCNFKYECVLACIRCHQTSKKKKKMTQKTPEKYLKKSVFNNKNNSNGNRKRPTKRKTNEAKRFLNITKYVKSFLYFFFSIFFFLNFFGCEIVNVKRRWKRHKTARKKFVEFFKPFFFFVFVHITLRTNKGRSREM